MAHADVTDERGEWSSELTYEESWGAILQRHRQWRCYVCADHTGEFADISVGDPWYRSTDGDPGRSLIVVRTDRGRRALREALDAGALVAEPVAADRIPASQPGLLKVRGAAWGRILACRVLRIPAPVYRGLPTFQVWFSNLSLAEKSRSIIGLVRRVKRKGLTRRHPVTPVVAPPKDQDSV
jgi:coenzyme F420 hydrogenase subunit beta